MGIESGMEGGLRLGVWVGGWELRLGWRGIETGSRVGGGN